MIRILIAEGSFPVRESFAGLLATERDFEVVGTAAHGEEAVQMAKRLAPDVVVMDSRLPVIDGIEATRLIKRGDPSIGVVMLSAFAHHIKESVAAGAVVYLLKGCAPQELFAAIIEAGRTGRQAT